MKTKLVSWKETVIECYMIYEIGVAYLGCFRQKMKTCFDLKTGVLPTFHDTEELKKILSIEYHDLILEEFLLLFQSSPFYFSLLC
jgi:hypothetical protein